MKKFGWMLVLLLTCSTAQAAETLVVPPYPASTPWKKITDKRDAKQLLIEWIPADQEENNIKDILTEQMFYANTQSPSAFLTGFLKGVTGACRDASTNGPVLGNENGHDVAYAQAYCVGEKGAGKDVDIFLKTIAGSDGLYVVQREFRRPAVPGAQPGLRKFLKDEEDLARSTLAAQQEANDYLTKQIKLCADAEHCPSPQPPAAKPGDGDDVSASFGFEAGKTTQDDVEKKFGKSTMPTHIADGRHTATYTFKGGSVVAVFLFGKDDILIRTRAYTHN